MSNILVLCRSLHFWNDNASLSISWLSFSVYEFLESEKMTALQRRLSVCVFCNWGSGSHARVKDCGLRVLIADLYTRCKFLSQTIFLFIWWMASIIILNLIFLLLGLSFMEIWRLMIWLHGTTRVLFLKACLVYKYSTGYDTLGDHKIETYAVVSWISQW